MHEYLKLNHSIYHSSCYIHDISNNGISIMPTYFITFFGMTVYVNIRVIYPLIQADPCRPTYPLCVLAAWGILISRQNCLLWSQAHMYFNSLRPSDRMAEKFWSSLFQPMVCPLSQLLHNINKTHVEKICDISVKIQINSIQNIQLNMPHS